jgi:hypothetical protein
LIIKNNQVQLTIQLYNKSIVNKKALRFLHRRA